ncbi:Thiopurine S-methyltransferase [Trichoplax sp. H2]|nr:Thiopurine S-methyltransferase [Trichoplax sp. H2]|eukprot:RDD45683.1 Thiopurine S-methyltransferase [Trichoplax sp. H2]
MSLTYKDYVALGNDTVEDWASYWAEGDTNWVSDKCNPCLIKYYQSCLACDQPSTIFVPLCGKTQDMLWLARNGNRVVGVEMVPQPCIDFFSENNIDYCIEKLQGIGDGKVYRSQADGLDITIYNCNFYELTVELLGCQCNRFWDIGALIALNPEQHSKYIQQLMSLLTPDAQGILFTVEFDINQRPDVASPFCVPENRVHEVLSPVASVKLLESIDTPYSWYGHLNLNSMDGKFYFLKRK